jgi:alpha-galactosidase
MFKGTEIELGGEKYVVPPLSLEKLEALEPQFQQLAAPSADLTERLRKLMPILLASFQRNYPEMTEGKLLELLDLPSLNVVVQAIMQANGFKLAAPGEPAPVQE